MMVTMVNLLFSRKRLPVSAVRSGKSTKLKLRWLSKMTLQMRRKRKRETNNRRKTRMKNKTPTMPNLKPCLAAQTISRFLSTKTPAVRRRLFPSANLWAKRRRKNRNQTQRRKPKTIRRKRSQFLVSSLKKSWRSATLTKLVWKLLKPSAHWMPNAEKKRLRRLKLKKPSKRRF